VPDYHGLIKVRFPGIFTDWRDWANCQILFWAGKDLFWALEWQIPWSICAVLTLVHTVDMIRLTWSHSVENLHYWAQSIWVVSNMLWALGELFEPFKEHSDPEDMTQPPSDWRNLRWWASWTIIPSLLPIVWLYILWVPATMYGNYGKSHMETRPLLQLGSKAAIGSNWSNSR